MTPHIAVILTDADKRIVWVNDDFTSITGYHLGEVIGKKPSLLQGPRSEQEVIHRIRKGLEQRVSLKECITNYRKNGEQYTCTLVIHPIFNRRQELINYIAFEVDHKEVPRPDDLPIMHMHAKYNSSSLKGAEELKLYYKLKKLLENEKLYLDPELNLKVVADRLATNTKYLSQVVNHYAGCNFQQFINRFRVKEVQQKILSGAYQNLTLFGIASKCGFKNKSTFYKVFKESTGQTPRAYQQQ